MRRKNKFLTMLTKDCKPKAYKVGFVTVLSLFLTFNFQLLTFNCSAQGVAINTDGSSAAGSAILDVKSTVSPYQGVLLPRLTTAQRDAISSPVESLLIFNIDTKCLEMFVNGGWYSVSCPSACTPPTAPVASAASSVGCTSLTANWNASSGATSYYLDVSANIGFTSFVTGYNNLNVSNVTSLGINGLSSGTVYYYRVRAYNACVSGSSNTITATTASAPTSAPTAGTHTPTQTQIVWNWNTVSGATGYKWNTTNSYAAATDNGASTTKTQSGLTCNTAYTLYIWAYNTCGNYTTPVTLTQTTSACFVCGTVISDYDANTYNTVSIGPQCWMKESLKTTHYSNGVALVDGTSAGDISGNYTTKYHFDPANAPANTVIYGKVYTWAAVMNGATTSNAVPSGVQGICPTSWHVPSDAEWNIMVKYVDNTVDTTAYNTQSGNDINIKLKEAGGSHWDIGNNGTNSSGFTALSSGIRQSSGNYIYLGSYSTSFWNSKEVNAGNAMQQGIHYVATGIYRYLCSKDVGISVRCVKD